VSEEQPPTGSTQEISQALADISDRAQVLIRDEIDLAKLEVTTKAKTIGKGAGIGIGAGIIIFYAVGLILVGLSLLAWYLLPVPDTALFWGFFLVAGILLLVAGLAAWIAVKKLQTSPTPDMAIEEAHRIRETIAPHEQPSAPGAPCVPVAAPAPAPAAPAAGGLSVPPVGSTSEWPAVPAEAPPAPVDPAAAPPEAGPTDPNPPEDGPPTAS